MLLASWASVRQVTPLTKPRGFSFWKLCVLVGMSDLSPLTAACQSSRFVPISQKEKMSPACTNTPGALTSAAATLRLETLLPPRQGSCWQGQPRCVDTLYVAGHGALCLLSSTSLLNTIVMKTFTLPGVGGCTPQPQWQAGTSLKKPILKGIQDTRR